MLDLTQAGQVDIHIELDRSNAIYTAGEMAKVEVSIACARPLKIHEVRVSLVCTEKYERKSDESREWKTVEGEWSSLVLAKAMTLMYESPQLFSAHVQIPQAAPPTCIGETIQVRWSIRITINRGSVQEFSRDHEIQLISRAPATDHPETDCIDGYDLDDVASSLRFQKTGLLAGGVIQGELVIQPKRAFRIAGIRIELVTQEHTLGEIGYRTFEQSSIRLAGRRDLKPEKRLGLAFVVDIPSNAPPTCRASESSVSWLLKGTLERRLRSDTIVEREILICSRDTASSS